MKESGPIRKEARTHGEHIHHWDDILGVETHWVEQGLGHPIVLLHPINSEWAHFERIIPIFAKRYHVYATDLPGIGSHGRKRELKRHGLNDYSQFLEEFFNQNRIEEAVVLGSSAGGMIASDFALSYPDRVSALILQDTPLEFQNFMRILPLVTKLRGSQKVIEKAFDTILPHIAYATWKTGFDPVMKKFSDRELLKFTRRMTTFSARANIELLDDAMGQDLLEKVEEITVPTLVIAGEEDIFPTPKMSKRLARHIPGSKLRLIAQGDHNLPVWKPDELTKEIFEFLESLPPKYKQ